MWGKKADTRAINSYVEYMALSVKIPKCFSIFAPVVLIDKLHEILFKPGTFLAT